MSPGGESKSISLKCLQDESPSFLRRRKRTSTRTPPVKKSASQFFYEIHEIDNINSTPVTITTLKRNSIVVPLFTCTSDSKDCQNDETTNSPSIIIRRPKTQQSSSSPTSCQSGSDCDSDDCSLHELIAHAHIDKKPRVSDSNISLGRYEQDFIPLKELADGKYSSVKLAKHRFDGTTYAIKVNKNPFKLGSTMEKKAMKEAATNAQLIGNEHIVKYLNSWAENGHVYIQNEFCNGGSFKDMINEKRENGEHFSEEELLTVLTRSLKGLEHIHSKQLAHMDIKPENILVSVEKSSNFLVSDFLTQKSLFLVTSATDFLPNSVDPSNPFTHLDKNKENSEKEFIKVFKIGDFGHAISVVDDSWIHEEEDCRYMAKELFQHNTDRSLLQLADIFSLGMTIYEAASLKELPKDSFNGSFYHDLRSEDLPFLQNYSERFNKLLKSMVKAKPSERPTASNLLEKISILKMSEDQLGKELERLRNFVNNKICG